MTLDDQSLQLECVLPIISHARLIMQWRNDPQTLKMSFHGQPKEWSSFFQEFLDDYFCVHDLPPLFVLYQHERVGFLRFTQVEHPYNVDRRCCEISINIARQFRGKGMGTLALKKIQLWVNKQGYDDIYAEVKENNEPSHKMFLTAGYEFIGKKQKKLSDSNEEIPIRCYLFKLKPELPSKTKSVFVIAEAGSNWRMGTPARDVAMAKTLIDVAVDAGADAVKFQTFCPETVYVQNAGQSDYLAAAGIKENIQTIFSDLAMPDEMIPLLADYSKKQGIQFMSTPFSPRDFAVVDPYVSMHKLASYEINHIRLLELMARSGKPLIMSTGAAEEEEIAWAIKTFKANGGEKLTVLQCTAKYPADLESMNLNVIHYLKERFHVDVGLSDHSRHPLYAPIAAVALGAAVIEKHFTIHNALPGPDHIFAVTPNELTEMVRAIRAAEKMRGSGVKKIVEQEKELRLFAHRGIQALRDISEGEILQEGVNISILRPGKQTLGIHPKFLSKMEGKPAKRKISLGSGIQHGDW